MFHRKKMSILVSGALLVMGGAAQVTQATAAPTSFDNFTPLASSVPAGSLPESAPFQLSSPGFSQVRIADRTTQNTVTPNSNRGQLGHDRRQRDRPRRGAFPVQPVRDESGSSGVQRIDLQDPNYNTRTVTIVPNGTQGFVSGDMSKWAPSSAYLTAEESWGAGSTKGRSFEVTNPNHRGAGRRQLRTHNIIPPVSHEGSNFDSDPRRYLR